MQLSIRHTQAARRDLREIWAYVSLDDSAAADRLLLRIAEVIGRLSRVPEMGKARPELAEGLRSFPVGRHIVFYEVRPHSLNVVRVLAAARNITSDLFEA